MSLAAGPPISMLSPLHSSSVAARQDILITSHLSFSLLIWERFLFSSCIKSPLVCLCHFSLRNSSLVFFFPLLLVSAVCLHQHCPFLAIFLCFTSVTAHVTKFKPLSNAHSLFLSLSLHCSLTLSQPERFLRHILRSQSGTPVGN